ncbi:endonuclease V [Haloarcula salinisoli]|uniref:Endonuclease V n=1 Tax=Haloarcula salinisoli TaxID=2487746 RepID=A0A8J7YGG4_9EURY|nr:endonuclease V [Halomicroarcula salinisoli]MBX0285918.1 endonuclease V [Halomicroarcula salinisoli]MBX0302589.1 endonuclease V [Halomicroarcula salinisoli]
MDIVRPEFVPDPSLSTAEMEALQRDIAEAAVFADEFAFDPDAVSLDGPAGQQTLGERPASVADDTATEGADQPLVAGVDQAFVGDRAISAIVVLRGREVIERVYAVEPTEIPYVPGLLSFREGGAILAAFSALEHVPDIVFVDGSGRIHYREAGLATHIGVTLDVPAIGVAKNLLCGRPRESLDRKLPEGARVAIEADAEVETATDGPIIGYAVQSRQYDSSSQYINPLVVSPGHRVSAATAADLVVATAAGYKLPEPTRLADAYADSVKGDL